MTRALHRLEFRSTVFEPWLTHQIVPSAQARASRAYGSPQKTSEITALVGSWLLVSISLGTKWMRAP